MAVLAVAAGLVAPGQAVLAGPARHDHLQRDPVAGLHAPALRGAVADLLDDPQRLVAGDRRRHVPIPRWPRYVSTSLPQMPLASTRSSPSSGPIAGRGNSRISICARGHLHGGAHRVRHRAAPFPRRTGSATGTAVPDQSAKSRTTIEIPALRAPATAMSRCSRSASGQQCGRSPVGALAARVLARRCRRARPCRRAARSLIGAPAVLGEPLPHLGAVEAGPGEQLGVLGQKTMPAEACRKIHAPVREIVSAKSPSSCSALAVCRLSTNSQVRSSVADTARCPRAARLDRRAAPRGSPPRSRRCRSTTAPAGPGWPAPARAGGSRRRCGRSARSPGRRWRWPGTRGRTRRPRS